MANDRGTNDSAPNGGSAPDTPASPASPSPSQPTSRRGFLKAGGLGLAGLVVGGAAGAAAGAAIGHSMGVAEGRDEFAAPSWESPIPTPVKSSLT